MDRKLRVLLIDDDSDCLSHLEDLLSHFEEVEITGMLLDGTQAPTLLRGSSVDLVFLDIMMDKMNGFSLAKHLKNHYPEIQLIFCTGYAGYAVDGYEYQPADFLLKPVDPVRLERALSHVKERLHTTDVSSDDTRIGIRTGTGLTFLRVGDIVYIERVGRKVHIVCANGDRILTSYTLQELTNLFSGYNFVRCHQSVIIPLNKVRRIQADEFNRRVYTVQVEGGDKPLPLSHDHFEALEAILVQRGIAIY